MKAIPLYDETAPIACTLGADEVPDRLALVERMRDDLDRLERTEHGLVLHFALGDEIEPDLRRFAIDEKRCCRFWGFAVTVGATLALRLDAPPAAAHLIDRLEAFFAGSDPAAALADLL